MMRGEKVGSGCAGREGMGRGKDFERTCGDCVERIVRVCWEGRRGQFPGWRGRSRVLREFRRYGVVVRMRAWVEG